MIHQSTGSSTILKVFRHERGHIPWGSESTKYSKNFCAQVGGDAGLPLPKEAGQQETIIVRMDDFPKVVQRNNYLLKVPNSKGCSEITISLKDSVIYWKLRAEAISDGKFSISNMANIYLVDVNKVMLFVDSICNCMDTRWYWYQNWHQLLHIQMCYVYPVDVKKVTIPTIDESPNSKIESF